MTFSEVNKIHKSLRGIFVVDGIATSLLCNLGKRPRYPNRIDGDILHYVVGPTTRRQDVDGLLMAMRVQVPIRVFAKRATNEWEELDSYRVEAVSDVNATGWSTFLLRRVTLTTGASEP